jgi:hypothetical protein
MDHHKCFINATSNSRHMFGNIQAPTNYYNSVCLPIGPQSESVYGPLYKYTNRHATYITSKSSALKMEQIECSETSVNINQEPGKHRKENTLKLLQLSHIVTISGTNLM